MKYLFKIDCEFSSLSSSLNFDFTFDVVAQDQADARAQAHALIRQSGIAKENHISFISIEKCLT